MTGNVVALVPAKAGSRRVPGKNFRTFADGMCLVELKIRQLQEAGIERIIVSSDHPDARRVALDLGAEVQHRPPELCGDFVNLTELFQYCLGDLEECVVYWAHPTSPFVRPASIRTALGLARDLPGRCVLGVQRLQEFLWSEEGPLNYDPHRQPRSQDLAPLFRVTGGIHIARGADFIRRGAVAFAPAEFVELDAVEAIDINTDDEWRLARLVAAAGRSPVERGPGLGS